MSQHGRAVAGYVLLTAFVQVALGVLLRTGLTGAAGTVAALWGRPPPDASLRAGTRRARHHALVLVRGGLGLNEGWIFNPLDAAGCFCNSDREGGVLLGTRRALPTLCKERTHITRCQVHLLNSSTVLHQQAKSASVQNPRHFKVSSPFQTSRMRNFT